MRLSSFEANAKALDAGGVRYLVAGGLAVNAHGYLRFAKDLDLVVQLVPDNVVRAFAALEGLGYRPSAYLQEARRHLDPAVAAEALIQQIERDGARQQPPHDSAIVHELREALGLDARP